MKKTLTIFVVLLTATAFAAIVVTFNPVTGEIGQVIPSADTLQYHNKSNALINPPFPATPLALCWVTNRVITAKTQAHLDSEFQISSNAIIAGAAAHRQFSVNTASTYMSATNAEGRILRMFALLTLDQINTLRKASVPALPIITTNAFLNAMANAVNADPR